MKADAIHGDKSQGERIAALDKFKSGEIELLVATDVAARGLDIQEMPCVINYDLPHAPEDYVHRIGRTGRAGAEGDAISLFSPDEEKYLIDIEKLIKHKIERAVTQGFEPVASEPHHHAGRHEHSRGRFDRDTGSRHSRNVKVERVEKIDPWFMKPYEAPVTAAAGVDASAPVKPPLTGVAKKSGIGALLGGRAKT